MNNNDITTVCNNKVTNEERETHLLIDTIDNIWIVDSSIPKDYRRFEKMGWDIIGIVRHTDGSIISMRFKGPRNAITIRSAKPKPLMSADKRAVRLENLKVKHFMPLNTQ